MKVGDVVDVTLDGRTVRAVVSFASSNGASIIVAFDAMLGGWAGSLPAYHQHADAWVALDGVALRIVLAPAETAVVRDLYDVARVATHAGGRPWTDPRTGVTHQPPPDSEDKP